MAAFLVIRLLLRVLLHSAAAFTLLFAGLAAFGMPYEWIRWFTARAYWSEQAPAVIVVLGGAGIPSESGLLRTWYGAEAALEYTNALVIVSLPTEEDPETAHVGRMKRELILRGVDPSRILMEHDAVNTHLQAAAIREMLEQEHVQDLETAPVAVVTSMEHLRRSLLCFHREGLKGAYGIGAVSQADDTDLGFGVSFRYVFWNRLEFQVRMLRELTAMSWYRLRGWI